MESERHRPKKPKYRIDVADNKGVRNLRVVGELDMSGVSALFEAIDGWEDLDEIVVDTTELTFIESVGLATLVAIRTALGPERFQLVPGPATNRLLDLTGTRDYLGVD